jgi:hypothetical protein
MGDTLTTITQIASGVGGVANSAFGGRAQYKAGQAQKAAYDYNAALAVEEAEGQERDTAEAYTRLIGRQASLYAKAGVDIASGSPLLIMAATAARGAEQEEMIREGGQEKAALYKYYGKQAAWSGEQGGISQFLSGLSAVGRGLAGGKVPTAPDESTPGINVPVTTAMPYGPMF